MKDREDDRQRDRDDRDHNQQFREGKTAQANIRPMS
jgi:hypothetical protein